MQDQVFYSKNARHRPTTVAPNRRPCWSYNQDLYVPNRNLGPIMGMGKPIDSIKKLGVVISCHCHYTFNGIFFVLK